MTASVTGQNPNKYTICLTISENSVPKINVLYTKNHSMTILIWICCNMYSLYTYATWLQDVRWSPFNRQLCSKMLEGHYHLHYKHPYWQVMAQSPITFVSPVHPHPGVLTESHGFINLKTVHLMEYTIQFLVTVGNKFNIMLNC